MAITADDKTLIFRRAVSRSGLAPEGGGCTLTALS